MKWKCKRVNERRNPILNNSRLKSENKRMDNSDREEKKRDITKRYDSQGRMNEKRQRRIKSLE